MDVLPSNLANWPPGKPSPVADSASRRLLSRAALRWVGLIFLGGLLGFGAYRQIVSLDEVASPATATQTTPAEIDAAPTSPDDAASIPARSSAPELDVTSLLGNQAESQNWAGYAATQGGYTGVSATWTVPDISLASPAGFDAAWVGIGGVRSRDLIQAGTQRTVLDSGATRQEAWVEMLPRSPETVPLTVEPGDAIRVSIDQQGPEAWLIAFTNISSGQTYQVTEHYASSLSSAEWVEEAPSGARSRTLPLDNFGTVRFSQASVVADAQVLTISQSGAHPVTMITPRGLHLAEPSRLGPDGESFNVTRTSTPSPRGRP